MKHATQPNPHQTLRRCAGGRADRGSAIILVLVSMVLLSILAASLLQLTRFERIPRSESNIEVVIASVIDEILNQATDDLLDDNGHYLNTANVAGGRDEPWDFPWTNPSTAPGRLAELNDGSTVAVYGGWMDDSWLADQAPSFTAPAGTSIFNGQGTSATNGTWRKITNLTGLYIGGDANGNADLSLNAIPTELPVNDNSNGRFRDTNLATTSVRLVDADGDGIGDSRWEWAPLRQVGATQYVMAVRIVDLSARMDMNIAMGPTPSNAGATVGGGEPRGDGPTELDGGGYVGLLTNTAAPADLATVRAEWLNVLGFRLSGNTGTNWPGTPGYVRYDNNNTTPPAGTRRDYWTDGASRVSNTFGRHGETPGGGYDYSSAATFGLVDAFELLQGNGVNSANSTTAEGLMPTFLRDGGQENTYATGTVNGWNERQFWELDPRKHITMFSGVANAARPYTTGRDRALKIDVNEAVKTVTGRDTMRNRIRDFLDNATGSALLAGYPHLTVNGNLANQLTANIADYIDDDNLLTYSGSYTGFEALPYITEVYTQRPYTVGSVTVNPMDGSKDIEWQSQGSTAGFAIEIGNPFGRFAGGAWVGRSVSLENVWLKIGASAAVELTSLTGMPNELAPGEVVIVYRNSAGGDATNDDLAARIATSTGNASITLVETTATMGNGTQTVSLHAEEQENAGSALGWYYSGCEVLVQGGPVNENLPTTANDFATIAVDDKSYAQTNYRGFGQGLRMMTVHPQPQSTNNRGFGDFVTSATEPSLNRNDGTGAAEVNEVTPEFGNEAKTGASTQFGSLDGQQIVWQDSPRERMHWIGDILQIPLIGPNRGGTGDATTMAAAFENAGMNASVNGISDLMLPYQRYSGASVAPVVSATGGLGSFNVPHVVLLMEQLTTFSPASDGENGDGSSPAGAESIATLNEDEVLVPGKINLNTATRETLERVLPFPDLNTRQVFANQIIRRREHASQFSDFGTGIDNLPGIAYTGLLFEQIENNGVNPSQIGGDTHTLGGQRIDLNGLDTATGATISAPTIEDGVVNDREEEIMLAKWLTEVAETRSDVFAAYIVVQGYPADNFTDGATESARLIIIFSRADVGRTGGGKAVEIGRFRIN